MASFNKVIKDKSEVKEFERVNSHCSEKYVPIKTSDFIETMDRQFSFKSGKQYRKGSNAHFVEMAKEDRMSVYIENSFDRTMSLRISFKYGKFVFGRVRQVHKGEPAVKLNASKEDIARLYEQASRTIESLNQLQFTQFEKEMIAKLALEVRGYHIDQVSGVNYESKNAMGFIENLLYDISEGNYLYTDRRKRIKNMRKITSAYKMVEISNKIWELLEDKFEEFYI